MFVIGFGIFYIASKFPESFDAFWWSCLLGLLLNYSFKNMSKYEIKSRIQLINEIFSVFGVKNGYIKYKVGILFYIIGALIGWTTYFSQTVNVLNCVH